jgi:hypothetical protein
MRRVDESRGRLNVMPNGQIAVFVRERETTLWFLFEILYNPPAKELARVTKEALSNETYDNTQLHNLGRAPADIPRVSDDG